MAELDEGQQASGINEGTSGDEAPNREEQDTQDFRRSPVSAFLDFSQAEGAQREQYRDDFDPDLFNEAVDLAWKRLRAHGAED